MTSQEIEKILHEKPAIRKLFTTILSFPDDGSQERIAEMAMKALEAAGNEKPVNCLDT